MGEISGWIPSRGVKFSLDRWMDYYNNDRCQLDLTKLSPNEYYNYITTDEYLTDIPLPYGSS